MGASEEVTFPVAPRGTIASVSVDDPGGLAADDVRYVALSGTQKPAVMVVTSNGSADRDAFYVQHALAAGISAYSVSIVGGVTPIRCSLAVR